RATQDLTRDSTRAVRELTPGLADVQPASRPSVFSAITFGRLEGVDGRLKHVGLAASAFGRAIANDPEFQYFDRSSALWVIGLSEDVREATELQKSAEHTAGLYVTILGLSYMNRDALFQRLSRQSVCLMISQHEGFGLVGWEAVAAEVPLI